MSTPAPYVFPPSQGFQGNDGPWSTFVVRAGTPSQNFNVLPSTSGVNVVIPLSEGCINSPDNITAPSDCGSLRGAFPFNNRESSGFAANTSTTWQQIGIFELNLGHEYKIDVNARYGYDTIGLAVQNSGGPTLEGQVVAGLARKQFFLGVLPLGIKPTNFSTFDNPQPSYLVSLKDNGVIPGLGFGYSAGARYRYRGVTASLVLGGYDASRYDVNKSRTFDFGPNDSFDFTVGLQNVVAEHTLHGTVSLLTDGIIVNIDSTLPYLWLPEEACNKFESAFGLIYDENTHLYLVNGTIHDQLKQLNPTVTFTLGDGVTAGSGQGNAIAIDLPYAAFELQANWPLFDNTTNYFPLKRATNSTQYTLGRAFLQEAYLSVDYERRIFNVSQAMFTSPMPEQQIVSILTQNATDDQASTPTHDDPGNGTLSEAGKAGLVVGASIAALLFFLLAGLWYRRRKWHLGSATYEETGTTTSTELSADDAKEAASTVVFEAHGDARPHEADSEGAQLYELPASDKPYEIATESERAHGGVHEMPARV